MRKFDINSSFYEGKHITHFYFIYDDHNEKEIKLSLFKNCNLIINLLNAIVDEYGYIRKNDSRYTLLKVIINKEIKEGNIKIE